MRSEILKDYEPFAKDHIFYEVNCPRWKTGSSSVDVFVEQDMLNIGGSTFSYRYWLRVSRTNDTWAVTNRELITESGRFKIRNETLKPRLGLELEKPRVNQNRFLGSVLLCALRENDDSHIDRAIDALDPARVETKREPGVLSQNAHWLLASKAADYLGEFGDESAVPSLLEALETFPDYEGYPIVRRRIVEALGKIGDPRAIPFVESLLTSKGELLAGVYLALARLGHREYLARLEPMLLSDEYIDRNDWVRAVAELAPEQFALVFLKILNDDQSFLSDHLRSAAAEALLDFDSQKYASACLNVLKEPDHVLREKLATALALYDVKEAIPVLKELLEETNDGQPIELSDDLALMIGMLGPVLVEATVETESKEESEQVLLQSVLPTLLARFRDSERAEFMLAVSALGDPAYVQYLPAIVMNEQAEIQKLTRAFSGLGVVGARLAGVMLKSEDWAVRYKVVRAISPIEGAAFKELLSNHLIGEMDPDVSAMIEASLD